MSNFSWKPKSRATISSTDWMSSNFIYFIFKYKVTSRRVPWMHIWRS
jgi:hypothetical protein